MLLLPLSLLGMLAVVLFDIIRGLETSHFNATQLKVLLPVHFNSGKKWRRLCSIIHFHVNLNTAAGMINTPTSPIETLRVQPM